MITGNLLTSPYFLILLLIDDLQDFGFDAPEEVRADLQAAGAAELEDAPYLIKAEPAAWKSVLAGKTDPIVGLMGGKLKLAKGSLFALLLPASLFLAPGGLFAGAEFGPAKAAPAVQPSGCVFQSAMLKSRNPEGAPRA